MVTTRDVVEVGVAAVLGFGIGYGIGYGIDGIFRYTGYTYRPFRPFTDIAVKFLTVITIKF